MKITLIEPASADYHIYSKTPLPRLGLPILGAILRNAGHDVKIFCHDLHRGTPSEWFDADLVGISVTTSTSPAGYKIAQRAARKGIPVVIGGPHSSLLPEEALQYADFCLRFEAEQSLPMLVERLREPDSWSEIPGLSYWDDGEIRHNPRPEFVNDLDSLPVPDLGLVQGNPQLHVTPMITSRGCPYNCEFCCVKTLFGRKYRFRSADNVLDELEQVNRRWIFFYDDNFVASPNHTKELLEGMMRRNIVPGKWLAQVRADVTRDTELLKLMKRTNCYQVFVGFESINSATLEAYNKKQNVDDIEYSISEFHRHGIKVHGMFVLGSDADTRETVRQTVSFARKHKIDTVQFMVLTPVPGTPFYDRMDEQGRIFTKRWELFDGLHVVHEPAQMSPFELQTEIIRGMRRFYSMRECIRQLARFQIYNAGFRYVGKGIVNRWKRHNKPVMQQLKDVRFWDATIQPLREKTSQFRDSAVSAAQRMRNSVAETGQSVSEYATETGQKAKEYITETGQKVREYMTETGQCVHEHMTETGQWVRDSVSDAASKISWPESEHGSDMHPQH
ncbi:MAG: radical SAM protein [Candidatus Hydrogenedentes bacterium]|nr:radical SAM protein [Candidatus Hydrogenedentota bacterium]